jgi:hypothetical protein
MSIAYKPTSIHSFAGSLSLKISYGYTVKEKNDAFISNVEKLVQEIYIAGGIDTLPWVVDIFPSRKLRTLDSVPSNTDMVHFSGAFTRLAPRD